MYSQPFIIQTLAPVGATSLGYMALLVISELLQDLLVHVMLVHEQFQPPQLRLLSTEHRALLSCKLYPPIFTSWSAFSEVMCPLFASTVFTVGFAFSAGRIGAFNLLREENRELGAWCLNHTDVTKNEKVHGFG